MAHMRWERLAALTAIYMAASGLAGALVIWLLTSSGSSWDPGEPALVREARLLVQALTDPRRRPFVACAALDVLALPLLLAARTHGRLRHGTPVDAVSTAGAATGLAAVVSALFLIAIVAAFHLVPFRIGIVARWSLTYYACLVLAYNLMFIPFAIAAFAVARRLGLSGSE